MSSFSSNNLHNAYVSFNKIDHLIQQQSSNEELSSEKISPYDNVRVEYIDDVEEGSVSLKSSNCDSKTSLNTVSPQKDGSQSSSSSLNIQHDANQIKLYESTV